MDSEITLLVLLLLGLILWIFAVPIYLMVSSSRLRRKIEALEARLEIAISRSEAPVLPQAPASNAKTTSDGSVPEALADSKDDVLRETPPETPDPVVTEPEDVAPLQVSEEPQDQNYVFTSENKSRLTEWLAKNWVSAIAVLSLTFAGIFFVRYGIEHGLLPPEYRVLFGILLGLCLIGAGERIRRKGGSGEGTMGDLLPATLSSGGIISIYAAILGARMLYDLIGTEFAFAGLVATATVAVVLGLLHGAFLAVMGILGAVLAPFVIGGDSTDPGWLFYYFALIGAVALATDGFQRTAWVSVTGMVATYFGAVLLHLATSTSEVNLLSFACLICLAALMLPTRAIRPVFEGGMVLFKLHRQGVAEASAFPTRLALAGVVAASGVAFWVAGHSIEGFWLSLLALAVIYGVLTLWVREEALSDAVPFVLLAMLAVIGVNGLLQLDVAWAFSQAAPEFDESGPRTLLWLTLFAMAVASLAAWKSAQPGNLSVHWAFVAAAFAPAVAILIALYWQPEMQLSNPEWALHVGAIALLLTAFAHLALRRGEAFRLQASLYAVGALNMIAFALSIVLIETALTLAFAGVLFSASWLDRRYGLHLLGYLVQVATVVCGYRLIVDPGVFWATEAPFYEVVLAFAGTIGLMFAALVALRRRERMDAIIVVESAAWSLPGILACILVFRAIDGDAAAFDHWALGLYAMIWMISGAVQAHRAQIEGPLQSLRLIFAAVLGGVGTVLLVFALTEQNPLNPLSGDLVVGPPVLDSLLVAYGLPALLIGAIAWFVRGIPEVVLRGGLGLAAISAAMWIGLEIRRLWQGPDLSVATVADGELYTYTVVMMLIAAGLLVRAIQTRSTILRRVAMGVIGLTVAKVFLVDIGGLDGLLRVVAFLALGLTLAALAWLDNLIGRQREEPVKDP